MVGWLASLGLLLEQYFCGEQWQPPFSNQLSGIWGGDYLRYIFCDKSDVKAFHLQAGTWNRMTSDWRRSRRLFDVSMTSFRGWSGGAMVLGKLPVPRRPTNLDDSRARAYCACSRCGWGCLDIFTLNYPFFFLPPSLWKPARYRLKYCLKGLLNPKQLINQWHHFNVICLLIKIKINLYF